MMINRLLVVFLLISALGAPLRSQPGSGLVKVLSAYRIWEGFVDSVNEGKAGESYRMFDNNYRSRVGFDYFESNLKLAGLRFKESRPLKAVDVGKVVILTVEFIVEIRGGEIVDSAVVFLRKEGGELLMQNFPVSAVGLPEFAEMPCFGYEGIYETRQP